MMRRILEQAEPALEPCTEAMGSGVSDVIAQTACDAATRLGAAAIVVGPRSGFTARAVARHRPRLPVIALAPDDAVRHRLSLVWGITALYMKWEESPEILLARFREPVRAAGLLAPGARVVVTAGWPSGERGTTNLVHVTEV